MTDTPLPGLEPPVAGDGAVVLAARRTLAGLEAAGHLEERHAVMAAALLTTARSLDRAATNPRSKEYAVANLVAQLRETWEAIQPEATDGGDHDAFDDLAAQLRAAMADEQRRAAAVRDTP